VSETRRGREVRDRKIVKEGEKEREGGKVSE